MLAKCWSSTVLIFQHLSNFKNNNQHTFPTELNHPTKGTVHTESSILNYCADHFASVPNFLDTDGKKHMESLSPEQKAAFAHNVATAKTKNTSRLARPPPNAKKPITPNHSCRPCTNLEIDHLVKSKPSTSAPGPTIVNYSHFKHGGKKVSTILTNLFNIFYNSGFTPPNILHSFIILLHKKKSVKDIENYRPITLACCLLKLYETFLLNRSAPILLTNKVPHHLQHACTPHQGSLDSITHLVEILLDDSNTSLILHSIDLSKAFDRVNRDILFDTLHKLGITGKLWSAIVSTYLNSSTQILIGAKKSKIFFLCNGIKQGSVLSTLLFVVSIHYLLTLLHNSNLGITHNNKSYPASCFVDDLTLMANNIPQFTKLLNIAQSFFPTHGCVVNHTKDETAHHNLPHAIPFLTTQNLISAKPNPNNSLTITGVTIKAPFNSPTWFHHVNARCNIMSAVFHQMRNSGLHMSPFLIPQNLFMYKRFLLPILSFGLHLVHPTTKVIQTINSTQASILRFILNLPLSTPTPWVLWEAGVLQAESLISYFTTSSWRKYSQSPHKHPNLHQKVHSVLTTSWNLPQDQLSLWENQGFPTKKSWNKLCLHHATTRTSLNFKIWSNDQPHPYLLIKPSLHAQTPLSHTPTHLNTPNSNTNLLLLILARANRITPLHKQHLVNTSQAHASLVKPLIFPPTTMTLPQNSYHAPRLINIALTCSKTFAPVTFTPPKSSTMPSSISTLEAPPNYISHLLFSSRMEPFPPPSLLPHAPYYA